MGTFELTVERGVGRIRRHEERVRCYVSTRLDDALRDARERSGGALEGVPYGLKDEFGTADLPTTGGSWRHRDRRATDSPVRRALDAAGAVLVGKTNLSDLGLAPEASSYVGGSTRNPFDDTRTAGGSSGGSAAAVAYGFHAFDWGTDIGGSIRLPAAFCGVLGMRLSHATWPIRELFPSVPPALERMCGQGPFARTTREMRAVLDVTEPHLKTFEPAKINPKGIALYEPREGRWPSFAKDVAPVLQRALDLPVRVTTDLEPPARMREINASMWCAHFEDLLAADSSISLGRGLAAVASAVALRGRLGDRRFHPATAELLFLIAVGRITLFRDRERARERAVAVERTFRDHWNDGQIVIAPVTAYPPPRIGRSNWTPDLLNMAVGGNLSDATCLAIPFGTFDGRLPRAIQLIGPPGSERVLLDLADKIIPARDADIRLRQRNVELS